MVIPIVTSTVFLGVTITNDLKWNIHISITCAKARRQLGFLYRHFHSADTKTLCQLYKSLILPILDYCSTVWDPHTITHMHINLLESVQRFAARLTTKQWQATQNQLLHTLNWTPLCVRRKKQKAMVCRRILLGHSVIPSSHLTPNPRPNSKN